MTELTIIRENLMNEKNYSPYCGNNIHRHKIGGCFNPRTYFNGKQFVCPNCNWTSNFPDDFIERYKMKWKIEEWNSLSIVQKAYKLSEMKDKGMLLGKKVETLTEDDIKLIIKNSK